MSIFGKIINRPFIFILALALAFIISSCSAPAEKLNQEGNQAFAEQAYLEALELYQSAQIESPELAEPYFNAANAFYRQGDFPAALEQMGMALQYIAEGSLAESSLYNLGNTLYNSQDLNSAIEAYTQALLLNPHDQDAKYNLELSLQQQEQQQQQQEQQEQNQDQQDESQSEEQKDSESESGEGDESEDKQQGDQESQNQENENQEQGEQESEGDQSQDQGEPNDEQQGDSSGQPQQGDGTQEQPGQIPPPGQRMTEEQARQLLAALASDMETLQEHLGQYFFARQAPPLQDW